MGRAPILPWQYTSGPAFCWGTIRFFTEPTMIAWSPPSYSRHNSHSITAVALARIGLPYSLNVHSMPWALSLPLRAKA